jgi:predicted transcriptional regulator
MAYIYKIINDINKKMYIGKTEFSIEKRFKEHCRDAFKPQENKRPLYAAMNKYGIEHFHIELIEETGIPEEREKFWIEKLNTFGTNGYNATLGGDGKKYIDYDLVIATYKEVQQQNEVAKILGISPDSVSSILKQNNIPILTSQEINAKKYSKIVNMYDLQDNFLRSFSSISEAGRYLIDNNLTGCKHSTIRQHIAEVCMGRRITAAKFKWRYGDIQ